MKYAKKSVAIPNQILIQENIDRAFLTYEKTNNIAKLKDFNVILLNGKMWIVRGNKYWNKWKEIAYYKHERTLIDIVTGLIIQEGR